MGRSRAAPRGLVHRPVAGDLRGGDGDPLLPVCCRILFVSRSTGGIPRTIAASAGGDAGHARTGDGGGRLSETGLLVEGSNPSTAAGDPRSFEQNPRQVETVGLYQPSHVPLATVLRSVRLVFTRHSLPIATSAGRLPVVSNAVTNGFPPDHSGERIRGSQFASTGVCSTTTRSRRSAAERGGSNPKKKVYSSRGAASSAWAIFVISASITASRIPSTNLIDPTTR